VEAALDVVVEKLERQIRDHREKRRARLIAGASRVKSANNQEQAPPVE
jgi:ribosome-associated translation inhibitor RaiA